MHSRARSSSHTYDYLIAGGGCAGLSLAAEVVRTANKDDNFSLLLVDREEKKDDDRTWCLWTDRETPWIDIASHQWDSAIFHYRTHTLRRTLSPYRYYCIRSIDYYRAVRHIIDNDARVHCIYGNIHTIEQCADEARLITDDDEYRARWLFDSTFEPRSFINALDPRTLLLQHFLGVEITAPQPIFDPHSVALFDFRHTDPTCMQFFYLLPFSRTRALIELTEFSDMPRDPEYYRARIAHFMRHQYSLTDYHQHREEFGIIPMSATRLPRQPSPNILNIGTKGGCVKGSTGYAFRRIQQDTRHVVASLRAHNHPFAIPAPRQRYYTIDGMLINVIKRHPHNAQRLFFALFVRNPIRRIFRLLDEQISLISLIALMSTMPWLPFICAYIAIKKKRP